MSLDCRWGIQPSDTEGGHKYLKRRVTDCCQRIVLQKGIGHGGMNLLLQRINMLQHFIHTIRSYKMGLYETRCGNVSRIQVAHDKDQCQVSFNQGSTPSGQERSG